MSFPKIRITENGKALMARVFSGERLQFTHFAIGSGECGSSDQWEGLASLITPEMEIDISEFQRDGDIVSLKGEFTNSVVEAPFWWREVGIFATLPDVADYGSVMCFYGNAEDLAEYVPGAEATVSVTHRWETTLTVSGTADVSAIVHSITYVTADQLNAHTSDTSNPHKVTAAQVGLGNVPNVSTNNQTPTFSAATTLTELTSGEKLSLSFGKIARAVKDLISHIANKTNPHAVSCEQIDAAPKNHRSTGSAYGMATDSYFGHAKITDDTSKEYGASDGIAASPKFVKTITGAMKYAGSATVGGSANSAVKLETARKVTVNLASETGADFDGSKAINPGVSGLLPMKHGGHGGSNLQEAQANLGIITLEELPNLYVWMKYDGNPSSYAEKEYANKTMVIKNNAIGGGTTTHRIFYADSITLTDGKFSLDSPASMTGPTAAEMTSAMLGKYVSSDYSSNLSKVYFIPEDATITDITLSNGGKSVTFDTLVEITPTEFDSFVASKASDTYPENGKHTDNYWYVYHKQLGE
ncbi:MAG: hypothetical protein IKJ99_03410 [Oscillospiraceae bacterium]|nr:hypothetical protein [Oscillospiraceae bacterium]